MDARRAQAPLRRLGVIGLLIALPVVLILTLWPTQLVMRAKSDVVRGLEWFHEREMLEWLYWTRLEVLANVAMLVPVALLLTFLLGRRRWWLAVALCAGASLGVETLQFFMPGRVASVPDIVANSLGACIGALLAVAVEASVARARRAATRRSAREWLAANR
ncbi:MAG: VanZ family protein [Actinomycetota bacterium]